MDVKKSKDRPGPAAARSNRNSPSSSSSSPKRRSARLSGKLVGLNLQKQVTLKNLGLQIKETPRTLLEGFASKQRNASLVKSDKTLELSSSRLESSTVFNESREKGKSFHEESFLHPILQKTSLPSVRKQRPAPDEEASARTQKSPGKNTEVAAGNRNWRRPKPVGRFNVKRQTKAAIEAAVVGRSSPREIPPRQNRQSASDPIDEEDKELEFTEASVDSAAISGIELSGSRTDDVDKDRGEKGDFAGPSSEPEMQADVDMETAETEVEKDVEYGTSGNVGSAKEEEEEEEEEETPQRSKSYERNRPENRSAVISFNKSHASKAGEKLMTSLSRSSKRKSVTTSSRLSLATKRLNVSIPQLSSAVANSSVKVPQLRTPVQKLSAPAKVLSSQGQQSSAPVQQLSPQVQQLSSQVHLTPPMLQVSTSVQPLSVPVPQLFALSAVPSEEASVISRMESNTTSDVQVDKTSRMEVGATGKVEAAVSFSRDQRPLSSVVETTGAQETHLSRSQVEEEEDTRVEASESMTSCSPWMPRLPPKAKTPMSKRKTKQPDLVRTPPQTSSAAKPKSRGAASRRLRSDRKNQTSIPRSVSHAAFKFFAGMKVSKEALEEVDQISEVFWSNILEDLELYAKHGKHSVVDRSDVELLMKRQRFVTENTSLNALIEKYMALEDREMLIPIARSGNRLE